MVSSTGNFSNVPSSAFLLGLCTPCSLFLKRPSALSLLSCLTPVSPSVQLNTYHSLLSVLGRPTGPWAHCHHSSEPNALHWNCQCQGVLHPHATYHTQTLAAPFIKNFFLNRSLLEYNCFTILCQFLLYNKVNQPYEDTPPFFFVSLVPAEPAAGMLVD